MANTVDALNPEVWAKESLEILTNNLIMGALVHTDFSYEFKAQGDSVSVTKPGIYDSIRKSVNSEVTIQDQLSESVSVLLDRHPHVSFFIKDGERFYAKEDLITYFMKPAIQALCVEIDQALLDLAPQFLSNSYGYAGALTEANVGDAIIGVRKIMNDNKVPVDRRNLVWCPESEIVAMSFGDFTRLHTLEYENYALRDKSIGRRFGFNNYTTQNLPVDEEAGSSDPVSTLATPAYDMPYFIGDQVFVNDASIDAQTVGSHSAGTRTLSVDYGMGVIGNLRRFVTIGNATYCVMSSLQEGDFGSTSEITLEHGLLEDIESGTQIYHYERQGYNNVSDTSNTATLEISLLDDQSPVVGQQILILNEGSDYAPTSYSINSVSFVGSGGGRSTWTVVLDRIIEGTWLSGDRCELNPHVGTMSGGRSCIQDTNYVLGDIQGYSAGQTGSLTVSTSNTALSYVRIGSVIYNVVSESGSFSSIQLDQPLRDATLLGEMIWFVSRQMDLAETVSSGYNEILCNHVVSFVPMVGQKFKIGGNEYTVTDVSVVQLHSPTQFLITFTPGLVAEATVGDHVYFNPQMLHKSRISALQSFEMSPGLFLETTNPASSDGTYSVEIPVDPADFSQEYQYVEVGGTGFPVSQLTGAGVFPVDTVHTIFPFQTRVRMPIRTIVQNNTVPDLTEGEAVIQFLGTNVPVNNQKFVIEDDENIYKVTYRLDNQLNIDPQLVYSTSAGAQLSLNPYGRAISPDDDSEPGETVITRYNLAFHRNAMALVTRPLQPPLAGTADCSIASSDKLSIRAVVKYIAERQGHLVTLDLLYGVKVLDVNLGAILLG